MMSISIMKDMWLELYRNLKIIGKIILLPLMIFGSICFILFGIVEFFIFDIWLILIEFLSKDGDVKSLIYGLF